VKAKAFKKRSNVTATSYVSTRVLRDVIVSEFGMGEPLEGWSLISATAISANGKVIAGFGANPAGDYQGWAVSLVPEPQSLVTAIGFFAILFRQRYRRIR
jgi:hypothetical protein